jgi:hypothetical protein
MRKETLPLAALMNHIRIKLVARHELGLAEGKN